jgi:hypothetical protein
MQTSVLTLLTKWGGKNMTDSAVVDEKEELIDEKRGYAVSISLDLRFYCIPYFSVRDWIE